VSQSAQALPGAAGSDLAKKTAFGILVAISLSHLLNDLMQSVISAIYPILKDEFALDFSQIGLIQLVFQLTASILQPIVGIYTDKRPMPFSLPIGMGCTLAGLLLLASASSYPLILGSVALFGFLLAGFCSSHSCNAAASRRSNTFISTTVAVRRSSRNRF